MQKNLSRYSFVGKVATNIATGTVIVPQTLPTSGREYLRLTDDDGKRMRLYLDEIEVEPKKGKLSIPQAQRIRARKEAGEKVAALAAEHGVNNSTIYDILSGRLLNDGTIVYNGKR